jgi:hypothetical protein
MRVTSTTLRCRTFSLVGYQSEELAPDLLEPLGGRIVDAGIYFSLDDEFLELREQLNQIADQGATAIAVRCRSIRQRQIVARQSRSVAEGDEGRVGDTERCEPPAAIFSGRSELDHNRGCAEIVSEDLSHGQGYNGSVVRNSFRAASGGVSTCHGPPGRTG